MRQVRDTPAAVRKVAEGRGLTFSYYSPRRRGIREHYVREGARRSPPLLQRRRRPERQQNRRAPSPDLCQLWSPPQHKHRPAAQKQKRQRSRREGCHRHGEHEAGRKTESGRKNARTEETREQREGERERENRREETMRDQKTGHRRENKAQTEREYLLGNAREAGVDGSSKPSANLANA